VRLRYEAMSPRAVGSYGTGLKNFLAYLLEQDVDDLPNLNSAVMRRDNFRTIRITF
jgi:hypothetical protein